MTYAGSPCQTVILSEALTLRATGQTTLWWRAAKRRCMTIEISGVCQAKCQYCIQHRLRKNKNFGSFMSPELFEKILLHLFDVGILNRDGRHAIPLYNWGEPFLNKNVNEILHVLRRYNQFASLSSNFIHLPEIDHDSLPTIKNLVLSLSGMTEDTYGRMHGHKIEEVLGNFNKFYALLREHSPDTGICVSWHRYPFNEHELWAAFKYFRRRGITFNPVTAFFNDGQDMMDYARGTLSDSRMATAKKDLFLENISESIVYHRSKSIGYRCPAWDSVVIDEVGELLLCCAYSRYDAHNFGNILELSADEIWKRKSSDPICAQCVSQGLARYYYDHRLSTPTERPLPPGGGLYSVMLRCNRKAIRRKWRSVKRAIHAAVRIHNF
jgi:sulfatase maturation enzyme AslB (radical SAM superfamily)